MVNFTVWLGLALVASIIGNFFAFWYIRRLLSKLWFVAENLGDLVDIINNYRNHLKEIYELEQFYGDEDIKFLLSHTTSLLELLEEYEDVYDILEEPEMEPEEEEEVNAEKTIQEENVFYAGARKRNS